MTRNPDPTILTVAQKRCDQCLFSSAKIVDDARRDEVLESCRRTGRAFECHKATITGQHVVCRGFYDADVSLVIRLGKLLGRPVRAPARRPGGRRRPLHRLQWDRQRGRPRR